MMADFSNHGGGGGIASGDTSSISSATMESTIEALRPDSDGSFRHVTNVLTPLLSDNLLDGLRLPRTQRRFLVRAASERIGKDNLARVLQDLIPALRLHPAKTASNLLADLGPSGTDSEATIAAVLGRFGMSSASPPSQEAMSELIGDLVVASGERGPDDALIHVDNFMNVLLPWTRNVEWYHILRSGLDRPNESSFAADLHWDTLAAILRRVPTDGNYSVWAAFWGCWSNPARHLQVLDGLTSLGPGPDTFSFGHIADRPVITEEDVSDAGAAVQDSVPPLLRSPWNASDLIETLIEESESDDAKVKGLVMALVDKAVNANAELVLLGLWKVSKPWTDFHRDVVKRLVSMFLAGRANQQLVFYLMWKQDPTALREVLVAAYNESAMNISRILDIAQEINALDAILDMPPCFLAMDLAALASRREFLNLDKWLQDGIDKKGAAFIDSALEFIHAKVTEDLSKQDPQAEHKGVALTVHTVATFLRALRSNGDNLSAEEIDFYKAVRNLCLQLHPRLMNLAPGTEGQEPGLHVVTFSQDVHKEVDGYYRQMYEEQMSIDDLIDILRKLKVSEDDHDRQVFACMVHTLFDEYRCFEMYYPPRELAMTAVVFGSLIQHQLIDYIPLGIAIRYVLDALRNPPDSNMFKFGLQALLRFEDRLPEWPQLGQALLSPANIQQSHPEIARIVRNLANGESSVTASASQANGSLAGRDARPPFSSINVDPLPADLKAEDPDETTSDKILFIVNNLSPSNLQDKLVEARRLIKPELHQWLSSYLVLQRVSIEPNNHSLYTDFLDGLDAATLVQNILHETLAKVKMLLNSDKTVQSTTERTILKNLGSWLGNLTLARDKPIRHRNLAFKELLIEGFDSNRLIVAIPFVCKVMEQCARSTIFRPPNPWLMAVLRLLVELYQFADLKLNLKFEIEVLCKSLSVDLKGVQCTTILRNRPQELAAQQAQQEAAAQRQLQALQQPPSPQPPQLLHGAQQTVGGVTQDLERLSMAGSGGSGAAAAGRYADSLNNVLQTLPAYVVFNPGLALFANNGALKRMVCVAIERAIREIIHPVVERSVTIASVSTRELITKDFAMESDEVKMRKAAHQMAQNLAGSLALVTCKEPLRTSMVTHARTLLLQSGFSEQSLPEQAVLVIMQENLDLACSVVERAAMEKSLQDVDEGLANAYMARRDHRLRGRGFYWDANALAQSQYASTLPDLLKLKPDGLQSQQVRVYEEFGKLSRATGDIAERSSASPLLAHMPDSALAYPAGELNARSVQSMPQQGSPLPPPPSSAFQQQQHLALSQQHQQAAFAQPTENVLLSPQQSLERFTQCINELDGVLQQGSNSEQSKNEIRTLTRQIAVLSVQSVNRDETALVFAQKVVQLLYKGESDLARDVYTHLLERLCDVSVKAAKEVTAWLVYAEDERKFNVAVTVGLIRAGLVNVSEQDAQLAKFMQTREFRPSIVDFSARLAFACLKEPACATRQQLGSVIETLMRAHRSGKSTQAADEFLSELQDGNFQVKTDVEHSQPLREQLAFCFAEWIRLFQHSPNAEKSFIEFVTQLQGQGILKGEEISSLFFRVCTEVGVDSYIKQKAIGGNLATGIFQPIDAFSKLVVLMIKYHADPTGNNHEQAKVHYLTKILSIVVLVLAQSHEELGPHFQQKPFFRFFSSLLHDLHLAESHLHGTYIQSLLAISNTLNTLQPSFFPGFTFSWMSLMSHRLFMPKLLAGHGADAAAAARPDGWAAFHRLFASLFKFLAPIVRAAQLQDTSRVLYRGMLRIVLVLLHDYPEFLAMYAHSLNDAIPVQCVQLRNLMLSAYRRSEFPDGLPDVFDQNMTMERIEQCKYDPPMAVDESMAVLSRVHDGTFKTQLDELLNATRIVHDGEGMLASLQSILRKDGGAGEYSVVLLNGVVLHSAIVRLQHERNVLADASAASEDAALVVYRTMLGRLDAEGRYLTANALCSQLRYPNRHTAYFHTAVLQLYASVPEAREALLRVLLERIIVNRPHPWGLLCTTFALLKDRRRYPMPEHTPPEIVKLLEHVRQGLGAVSDEEATRAHTTDGLRGAMNGGGGDGNNFHPSANNNNSNISHGGAGALHFADQPHGVAAN